MSFFMSLIRLSVDNPDVPHTEVFMLFFLLIIEADIRLDVLFHRFEQCLLEVDVPSDHEEDLKRIGQDRLIQVIVG